MRKRGTADCIIHRESETADCIIHRESETADFDILKERDFANKRKRDSGFYYFKYDLIRIWNYELKCRIYIAVWLEVKMSGWRSNCR